MTKQTNAAMAKQNATKGTWTFVNETRSLGNDMNSRLVGSGTITFNEGRFVQNDKVHQHQEGAYSVDWLSQMLNLDSPVSRFILEHFPTRRYILTDRAVTVFA